MLNIVKTNIFNKALIGSTTIVIYFICTSQFWVNWWIILMPIGLLIFVVFAIILVNSMVFWIKNRTIYRNPHLPFLICIISIVFVYWLPSHLQNKDNYLTTTRLLKKDRLGRCNLYLQYYSVYRSGAFGSDINSVYVTDSLNFRLYVGSYDESERIEVDCRDDRVFVKILSWQNINPKWSEPQIIKQRLYSIEDLKQRHIFD